MRQPRGGPPFAGARCSESMRVLWPPGSRRFWNRTSHLAVASCSITTRSSAAFMRRSTRVCLRDFRPGTPIETVCAPICATGRPTWARHSSAYGAAASWRSRPCGRQGATTPRRHKQRRRARASCWRADRRRKARIGATSQPTSSPWIPNALPVTFWSTRDAPSAPRGKWRFPRHCSCLELTRNGSRIF
jgi:hypothetical protein